MSRDQAAEALTRNIDWGKSTLRLGLEWYMKHGLFDDTVIVASTEGVHGEHDLGVLERLRSLGLGN